MTDRASKLKPYVISLFFTFTIFLSNRIVSSGFRNLSDISFKFKHLAFVLVLFLVIYYLLKKKELWNVNKKTKISLLFVSLLFSVLNVLGTQMAYTNRLFFGVSGEMATLVFCASGYFCSFYGVASVLLYGFNSNLLFVKSSKDYEKPLNNNYLWVVFFIIILLFWLIWIIAYYPSTVDYDTEWQLCSYLGYWPKTNHHPWFSTCVVGFFFELGRNMGDDNYGMFAYVFLRAICLALIFSKVVLFLKQSEVKNSIVFAILLFYAITPVWGAYAKQPFKDTFAAGLFCWFIMQLIVLIKELMAYKNNNIISCLLYSLSGLLASLFRHNYFCVVLITTVILFLVFVRKKTHLKNTISILLGVVIYIGFNYYILNYCDVLPSEPKEALSLPFQQTARVLKYHGSAMSDEEKRNINCLLDVTLIGKKYDPVYSEAVKNTYKRNASKEDKKKYFYTWARQFFDYPISYIEATIAGTYGYYAFTKVGYPSGGDGNCGMVILDNINKDKNAHFDEYFKFNYFSQFKNIRGELKKFYIEWHKNPLLGLTDRIPLYTWFLIIVILYLSLYSKGILVIPSLTLGLAFLTCIASPVNGSFRYFSGIAASVPLLLITLNVNEDRSGGK